MLIAALVSFAVPLSAGVPSMPAAEPFGGTPAIEDSALAAIRGTYVPGTFTEERTRIFVRDRSSELVESVGTDIKIQMDIWWSEPGAALIYQALTND